MDGHYYHYYASTNRMWHMPRHPGPYPPPEEPPPLEELGIPPPTPEDSRSPVPEEVSRGRTRSLPLLLSEGVGGTAARPITSKGRGNRSCSPPLSLTTESPMVLVPLAETYEDVPSTSIAPFRAHA